MNGTEPGGRIIKYKTENRKTVN